MLYGTALIVPIDLVRCVGSSMEKINPDILGAAFHFGEDLSLPSEITASEFARLKALGILGRKIGSDSRNISTLNHGKTSETQRKPMRKFKRNPPRRHIIQNTAELASSFAKVAATPSEMAGDWVARNGDKSIFYAFHNVLPEVSAPPQH